MAFLKAVAPYLLLSLFGIFLYAPVLFHEQAFFGEEQMGFYYAISYAVDQAVETGVVPLWQGAYYGGVSTSLDQFYGNFYPINLWLFKHLDFFVAHHVSITLATTLGLIFSYLFGRELGWRRASSIALGLFYFSATTLQWLEIGTIAAHSFLMLPMMLYALARAVRVGTRRAYIIATLVGGAGLGVGFLAGFMQIVFYNYCVAGAYALFLGYEAYRREKKYLAGLVAPCTYGGMTVVGFAIGFKQFFPSAHLIDLTIRTKTYAIQNAYHPFIGELLPLILPPNFAVPYLGGGSSSGFYIGAFGIVMAVLGALYYRTRTSVFFAGLYAFIVALAFHLPLFGWLNEHIPPFSHMGGNFRWMVGGAFPLAFLGASGFEGFLRHPDRLSRRTYTVLGSVSALIAVGLVAGSLVLKEVLAYIASSPERGLSLIRMYAERNPLHQAPEHYLSLLVQAVTRMSDTFSLENAPYFFGVVSWSLVALFFFAYHRVPDIRRYLSVSALAIVIYTVMGAPIFEWRNFVPQTLYYEQSPLAQLLQARESDPHSYRILGFIIGDGLFDRIFRERALSNEDMTALQLSLLINNSNVYHDIERMDGMAPYRTQRVNQLLDTAVGYNSAQFALDDASPNLTRSALDQLYNRDVQRVVNLEEKKRDFIARLPLLSMMNVKYIYTFYELESENLARIATLELPAGEKPLTVYVYENKTVLPRAYIALNPQFVAEGSRDAFLNTVTTKNFDDATIIECATCDGVSGGGAVNVESYLPGVITIRTSTPEDAWLVLGESNLPGWSATVDGEPTPIHTANYLFQSVKVPKGEHTVQFTYRDATLW